MNLFRRYIKFHIQVLYSLYRVVLLKTDKRIFALLFNLKSLLIRSDARLSWNGTEFVVTDKSFPSFSYLIRHQRQCNMAYEFGVIPRAVTLADCYFLRQIGFQDGDIFIDCGANVGDLKLWFDLHKIDIVYIGFEPSPIEFKCLEKNVRPSEVHNVGLWNSEGDRTFYLSSQTADSSFIEPQKFNDKVIAKAKQLESYIEKRVKCLKLEAEGTEPEILEGLGEKLQLIDYVSADLGYERGIDAESTLVPVTNYLLARGFELVNVSHDRVCALYKNTKISKDALQHENILTSKAEMKALQQQMVEAEKVERDEALEKVGRRNDTINNIIRLFSKKVLNILINLEKKKLIDRYKSYTGRYWAWRDSKDIKHDEKILFIDLGANVGQAYKCFSNYFDQKNISFELFEPNPFCYEKLLQLPTVISGDVVVRNVGVGPKAGTFKFYGLADSEGGKLSLGGSIVKQHNSLWYSASSDTAIDIELINFIDYLNEKSKCFDKIIVKMDIESAEVELLEALIENQAINHISILYVDFHSQYQEGTQSKKIKKREGDILSHIKRQTDVKFRMWH
ncbi:MAG: hypothetical protein CMH70_00125 [Nitrosomonadaceae bacterium]|nr:hypothetical protein [Nitrosomonadaceae bacterium]